MEDNTIFFTAAIVHTLKGLLPRMDKTSKALAIDIIAQSRKNYRHYQSRNGEPTYNFWPTTAPDLPFPNGNKFISNPKMRLPDDLDTSILIAMGSEEDSVKTRLREKMVAYASRESRSESKLNTLKKYESSEAYEAWFAKDMPQTFDICVLSNVMLFVFDEGYPLNRHDTATISLIKRMLLEDDLREHMDEVSHHTTSQALILYHVARMIHADREGFFQTMAPVVVGLLFEEHNHAPTEFEKMLAATSLMQLGQYSLGTLDHKRLQSELNEFTFFSVKPFLGNPQFSFLNRLVPNINWTSESYNWVLYLEYLYLLELQSVNLTGTR